MKQALCKDARMQDCKVFNSEQTDTLVRPKSGFTPTKPEVSCVPMLASVTLRDAERVRPNPHDLYSLAIWPLYHRQVALLDEKRGFS